MYRNWLKFKYWLSGSDQINFQIKHVRGIYLLLAMTAAGIWYDVLFK